MSQPYYKTNELARLAGISKNTLLRWEEEKLIPPAQRDGRGWRVWSKSTVDEILDIKRNKETTKPSVSDSDGLRVNIIGYGNQASTWSKNLRDSGTQVNVLLRKQSSSIKEANNDGFEVLSIEEGLRNDAGGIFCVLIPDEEHDGFFRTYKKYISRDSLFIFAHGYSVAYQGIKFDAKKALLAPKAIAKIMRSSYVSGETVPAVFCTESSQDRTIIKNVAKKAGLFPLMQSTFLEETISDLFTEQMLMCGGVPALVVKTFEILKKKGISEEIAAQECVYELSYILDVIKEKGVAGMYEAISPVAMSGGFKIWQNINKGESIDEVLKNSFSDIESKRFLHTVNTANRSRILSEVKKSSKNLDEALKVTMNQSSALN
ncbi:MAG: MerR family DNA-binding transcriptional regulator [Pseudomonadota bacterium]